MAKKANQSQSILFETPCRPIYVLSEHFFIFQLKKVSAKNLIFSHFAFNIHDKLLYLNFELNCTAKHWIKTQVIELRCLRGCIYKPKK